MKKINTIIGMALALAISATGARAQGMLSGLSSQTSVITKAMSQDNIGQASGGLNALYENFGAGASAAKSNGAVGVSNLGRSANATTLSLARPTLDKTESGILVPEPKMGAAGSGKNSDSGPWGAVLGVLAALGVGAGALRLTDMDDQQHNPPPQNPRNDPHVQQGWDNEQRQYQQRNQSGNNVQNSSGTAKSGGNNGNGTPDHGVPQPKTQRPLPPTEDRPEGPIRPPK